MIYSRRIISGILLATGLALFLGCGRGKAEHTGGEAGARTGVADTSVAGLLGKAPGVYVTEGDRGVVTIPFEFYGMNLLIHGTMNGKKVSFLIDNGRLWDQVWFYDGEADSLNLHYLERGEAGMVTGSGEEGGSAILEGNAVDIDFGTIRFIDQPTLISPSEAGWGRFFPGVAGQVSSMLFKHFVVTFDFDANTLVLTKPAEFDPAGAGEPVRMRLEDNGAYSIPVTARLPGSGDIELALDIDLGGIYPLELIENRALDIVRPAGARKEHLGYGASGEITGYSGRLEMVRVDGYELDNVPTVFVEKGANADADIVRAGTVGLPLMKRFNITFDYFNNMMYLEANESFGDPFE